MSALEYKVTPAEFKANTNIPGQYEGYFSIFGNIDDGLDVIEAGAFTKTLQERARRIKVFMAHDWSKLLGPPPDVIHEDSRGLYAKGRLTLGSFWGKEAWELMADGALTEGSIGFFSIPDKTEYRDNGVRVLREVKLYEISPVPLGMNPLTDVQAIKSLYGRDTNAFLNALGAFLHEMKAGSRHSKADTEMLNTIHRYVVDLGATTCKGVVTADEEPSADDPKAAPSRAADALTLRLRLQAAELALAKRV
ncbi:MAG: HK97 family phage prohead protease [Chloroflexi bacterium]|nr:HK97 family phage prohead protease [Chloroflexota bacterium]